MNESDTHVRISKDLYDKLAALASKEKRSIKLQLEVLLEKVL